MPDPRHQTHSHLHIHPGGPKPDPGRPWTAQEHILAVYCWGLGILSLACFATVFIHLATAPACLEAGAVAAFRLAPLGVECVVPGATAVSRSGSWELTWILAAGTAGLLGTLAVRGMLEDPRRS